MISNSAALGIDKLHGVGVVVQDLQKSIEEFSHLFGIEQWQVYELESADAFAVLADGKRVEATMRWARGGTRNISFDIVQPLTGNTVFSKFLAQRGPGILDITTHLLTPSESEAALPRLAREGIGVLQTLRFGEDLDIIYLDSAGQIGTVVKLLVARQPGGEHLPSFRPGRILRIAARETSKRLPIEKPYHVCVVTRSRRNSVQESFQRIFGIEHWGSFDNETGVTSSNAHYFGREAHSRFRLSLGRRQQFAVEVVEMIYGENVYQDMLDAKGEGVHHIMTTVCDPECLEQAVQALAQDGYSIVQDGAAGPIYYGYLAASGKLADVAVEVLCPMSNDALLSLGGDFASILIGPEY